jgi:hypothetical protein
MSALGSIAIWQSEGNSIIIPPRFAPSAAPIPVIDAQENSSQNEGFYWNRGNLCAVRLGGIEETPDMLPYMDQYFGDGTYSPCGRMKAGPLWFPIRWAVAAGSPSFSIYVKQVENLSSRPTAIIKANPAIGINSDIILTAGSSTGWVQLGPQTVSPTGPGGLMVELHNNLPGWRACYWANLVTVP